MKRAVFFVIVACALLATSPAAAQTTIIEPIGAHFPYQRWIDEAEVPTPDVTLTIVEGPCPYVVGAAVESNMACTVPAEHTIWMNPPALLDRPELVFLHEVGHNVDFAMPEWMRWRYQQIEGLPGPWVNGATEDPLLHESPNEQFATSWAECAKKSHYRSGWDFVFGAGEIGGWKAANAVCRMLGTIDN